MPEFRLIGTAPTDLDADGFRRLAREAVEEFARCPVGPDELERFTSRLRYVNSEAGASGLSAAVEGAEADLGDSPRRLYYLSVPPAAAADVVADARRGRPGRALRG